MNISFTSWLQGRKPVLTDENKEKVSIITDINKMMLSVGKQSMSSNEFDYLYDMPLKDLREREMQTQITTNATINQREWNRQMGNTDAD